MKLLFVISSLSSGGAERVVSILANYFVHHYEVTILTMSKNDIFYTIDDNIEIIEYPLFKKSENIFDSILNNIYRLSVFRKVFKQEKPDVIISFMTQTNILAVLAAKTTFKKVIVAERTVFSYHNSILVSAVRRVAYSFSDALVTQTRGDMQNYTFLDRKYAIANPIQVSEKADLEQKEKIVLAVGRLDKQKGFEKLIRVFHKLDKKSDWKLVIIGEGNERATLEKMIENLKIENVLLPGKTKGVFDWYCKASIFVLTSQKEGFPNVLLEAMAFGCAVVSFDCPYGPGEIIENGQNGILVENQNEQKLQEAIALLMEDEKLRERLSKEAVKVREKYAVEKVAGEWEKIMKKIIDE